MGFRPQHGYRAWLCASLAALAMAGCNGPFMMLPGGKLSGPEAPLPPASGAGVMALETRPEDPYSVHVGYIAINGQYYVDPAAERSWYQHLAKNPQLRVRLEGSEVIHPASAEAVTDPQVLAQFEPERKVLRIVGDR